MDLYLPMNVKQNNSFGKGSRIRGLKVAGERGHQRRQAQQGRSEATAPKWQVIADDDSDDVTCIVYEDTNEDSKGSVSSCEPDSPRH